MTDTHDDSITYVDSTNIVDCGAHIHIRGSDRCIKAPGELCENDLGKLRARLAAVRALVDAADLRSPLGADFDQRHPDKPAAVIVATRDLRAALAS